jgi:hypothetical protein
LFSGSSGGWTFEAASETLLIIAGTCDNFSMPVGVTSIECYYITRYETFFFIYNPLPFLPDNSRDCVVLP